MGQHLGQHHLRKVMDRQMSARLEVEVRHPSLVLLGHIGQKHIEVGGQGHAPPEGLQKVRPKVKIDGQIVRPGGTDAVGRLPPDKQQVPGLQHDDPALYHIADLTLEHIGHLHAVVLMDGQADAPGKRAAAHRLRLPQGRQIPLSVPLGHVHQRERLLLEFFLELGIHRHGASPVLSAFFPLLYTGPGRKFKCNRGQKHCGLPTYRRKLKSCILIAGSIRYIFSPVLT